MPRWLAGTFGFSLAATVAAFAAESPPAPMFQRGAAFALSPEDGRRIPIPLESTEVLLDVKPGFLEAQVTQTFVNRTQTALEATYLYPLPDRATLTNFELHYPDHIVRSEVREKVAARAIYDAAKTEGKKTALLEQRDPSLFSTEVANFLPGERVQVVIRFVQPLVLTADTIEVRFPMVTGDKYFPADSTPGTEGNAAPNPERRAEDTIAEIHVYTFDIQTAGIPVKTIDSPSHGIRTTQTGRDPEQFTVMLENQITIPDRDFVLRIATRSDAIVQPTVVTQRTATGDYGLLTVFPPRNRPATSAAPRPRDILFLLDRSGSMSGTRLDSAKLGLEGCLDALAVEDRFQIVTFDDKFEFYQPAWINGGGRAFADAHEYVRSIQVRGGTEVQRALRASLEAFQSNERDQVLILLTDGDVGNAASLLNLVENKIGRVRLFVLGIGSAPNVPLLKQVAEIGRGQVRFISNDAEVARELTDLFATLAAPVFTQPRLALLDTQGNPIEHTTFPEQLPDVFLARPLQVVYRSMKGPPAAVLLEGVENGQPVAHRLALQPSVLRGDGLEKEYGRRLYADTGALLRRAKNESERLLAREEMLATALQFQLVTELTSRVAVDEEVSRDPSATLTSQQVAQFRAADQRMSLRRTSMTHADGTVELTPFEVNTSSDVGYMASNTLAGGRINSNLSSTGLSYTLPQKLIEDFALPTPEAILPFAIDPHANPLFARPGADTGLLDDLPIATVVDGATIASLTLQPAGPARSEIAQHRPGRATSTRMTGRFGSDGFAGASLRTAFHPAGDAGASVLAILSWATFEDAHTSVYLEGEKALGETRARLGAQWRDLAGYGGMRLVRGALERKLGDGLLLEGAFAWHELKRDDATQFRFGSATAQYDGLGFLNLDLLTADTRRIADQIAQVKLSGNFRGQTVQAWSLRGRWHRQESDWLTPAGVGVAASTSRRDTGELDFSHRIGPADNRFQIETHLGVANHEASRTTRDSQTAWNGSLQLERELSEAVRIFGTWSHEDALPWASTGRWTQSGGEMLAVAPTLETRAGGQMGLKFEAASARVSGTIGAFHEDVSGHAYRDWSWERTHSLLPVTMSGVEIRLPVITSVAGDFAREGWTGSLAFNPSRTLTALASWSVDWKNEGPYRGGNQHGTTVVRYEGRTGRLKGWAGGVALHYRNALLFDDGFELHGGWRADAMLGYRLRLKTREMFFQLNVVNLADRSWQLTRFAPDHGRQVIFSASQGF